MQIFVVKLLLMFLTSNVTKTLIAVGVNKLVDSKKDGVTKDIAKVMIEGIAKSKLNPTTEDLFSDVINLLSPEDEVTKSV